MNNVLHLLSSLAPKVRAKTEMGAGAWTGKSANPRDPVRGGWDEENDAKVLHFPCRPGHWYESGAGKRKEPREFGISKVFVPTPRAPRQEVVME